MREPFAKFIEDELKPRFMTRMFFFAGHPTPRIGYNKDDRTNPPAQEVETRTLKI